MSVIHFIGPHKPWHSIPYRATGSSVQSTDMVVESSTETPATQQRAYDYGSLVDRWYGVYDRHYRSQSTEPVFQPTRYTSAWNEEGIHRSVVAGETLGLEELRRAALEGMGASRISAPRVRGEGDYRTMPLEGRFDLIRPRTRAERMQVQALKDEPETPESTPIPTEPSTTMPEPSTPPAKILSPPSGSPVRWATLPTPGVHDVPPTPYARLVSLPPTPFRHVPAPHKSHNTREVGAQTVMIQSQQRESEGGDLSLTPPWNSAVETPPNVVMPAPTDTYFPKVWDVDRNWSSVSPSSSETSLTTMEPSPSKPQPTPNAFFTPSLVPAPSEMLRRPREYLGEENGSPAPDPIKVKRIFPWEERQRHAPGRVFPDEGLSLTTLSRLPSATPERKVTFRSSMPSPLVGFPPSLQSHYPFDGPLSQRHAGKVPLSVLSSSPFGLESKRGREQTSSQDGDVEDEVDSEEETAMGSRTRSSSIEMAKRTLKYRSIGVQTNPREVREEGIQVTTFVPVTEVAEKLSLMNKRLRRTWSTPTAAVTHVPTSSLSLPILDCHHSVLPSNSRDHRAPTALASDETGDLSPSSAASLSDISFMAPPSSHVRKGSRVWDPARGVETFKRGSEEVLTKFMRIGSWEGA